MAGGVDFQGATGASYTLTKDEEGKAISVRVSFADDRDSAEELTSAPNAPVEPEPDEPEPTEPAESPPSAPRNLSISAAGTGILALSWVEPSDPGSPRAVRYIAQWKECCWSRRRNKMAAKLPIADMFSWRRPCEIDQAGDASESGERRATRERPWQRREPWVKSLAIIPAPGSAAAPVPRNVPPQGELQVGVGVLSDRPRPGTLIPALETPEDEFVAAVLVEAGQVNPGQSGRLPHLPTVRRAGQEDTVPSEIFPDAGRWAGSSAPPPDAGRWARGRQRGYDPDAPDCRAGPRTAIRPGVQRRVPGISGV